MALILLNLWASTLGRGRGVTSGKGEVQKMSSKTASGLEVGLSKGFIGMAYRGLLNGFARLLH